jgi:hypothetical protein
MNAIRPLEIRSWTGPFTEREQRSAADALESGRVLFLPTLPFTVSEDEQALLTPEIWDGKSKNIVLPAAGDLRGSSASGETARQLAAMMKRYSESAGALVRGLFPTYSRGLEPSSTTYRPLEISGRVYAKPIEDDRKVHVDSFFPSKVTRGRRILRVFSTVDIENPRLWRVGERFESFAEKFLTRIRKPLPMEVQISKLLGSRRRHQYDRIMRDLHDQAKLDDDYQSKGIEEFAFPAGSSWMCYTDQVLHAALAGRNALEQTFFLDPESMVDESKSPLRQLERLTNRTLV